MQRARLSAAPFENSSQSPTADSSVAQNTRSVGMTIQKQGRARCPSSHEQDLAAAAGAAATSASVAAAVSRHDAAAEAAARSVTQVDQACQLIGGVNGAGTSSRFPVLTSQRGRGALRFRDPFGRRCRRCPQSQVFEQHLLLAGEEAQLEPAEDVIHDRLGVADVRIAAPAAGFEARVRELLAEQFQRHAVLQRDRDAQGEAVHQAADRRSFFSHGDEEFAGIAVGIEADGDVALVISDLEFMRDRSALFLQLVAHSARRSVEVLFFDLRSGSDARVIFRGVRRLGSSGAQRLRLLASVTIDCDRLDAELPGLQIRLHDVFNRSVVGKIDRLRDRSRDERLRGRHHAEMPHVSDGARALRRLERAIEDGKVIVLHVRRPFDRARSVDVADDGVGLLVRVSELEERSGHGIVDDLDHAAANQLLVFHQREVRLNASSIAVHHEADGAGGSEHGDLAVAIAELFAVSESFIPALLAGFVDIAWDIVLVDAVHACAVHADYVEERLAIDVPAGAGSAGHDVRSEIGLGKIFLRRFSGGDQRLALFCDSAALQISFAAHNGGDAGGVVASGVGVVGKPSGHQQRAKIRIAQAERTIVVRVRHDRFRRISGIVDQNLLRGDENIDCVAIGFHVERAVGRELQQIEAGQVAGGIIEEHVFAARIAGVDASRVLRSVPAIDRGVVLHAGIAAVPGRFGNFVQQLFGFVGLHDRAIGDSLRGEIGVANHGVHEVVGHANAVVGVLEEDGRVGVGVGMRSVISHGDQRVRLGFFFLLALDEFDDVGMIDVEDDHLGRAASLAAGLDDAGKSVESLHEAERAAGGAAAGKSFRRSAQGRQIRAGAAAPLEEHAFGLGESQDRVERIFHRVDEAGRALRLGVSGDAEFDALRLGIPVPAASVGVGLDTVASDVEPDGRVEGRVLADEDVHELVVECRAVVGGLEIALRHSPVADGFGDTGNELANSGLALTGAELAVQIFAGHDIGRSHGPVFGDFDVLLLEDHVALGVGDLSEAEIPFDFVVGRDTRLGKQAAEGKAGGLLLRDGGVRDSGVRGDGGSGSGGFGSGFQFGHQVS